MGVATGKGGIPTAFLKYNRWDVISAFHKELRRGDIEKATYWLEVMTKGGAPDTYILSYLWHIGPEELSLHETELMTWLGAVRSNVDKVSAYFKYYAVIRFCQAKKWWQCEDSKRARELWAKNQKELYDAERGTATYRDFPAYVHDKHTSKGQHALKNGTADQRLEGSWAGMVWRAEAQAILDTERMDAEARDEKPVRKELIDVTWDEVWSQPKAKGQLEFWTWMEANGM